MGMLTPGKNAAGWVFGKVESYGRAVERECEAARAAAIGATTAAAATAGSDQDREEQSDEDGSSSASVLIHIWFLATKDARELSSAERPTSRFVTIYVRQLVSRGHSRVVRRYSSSRPPGTEICRFGSVSGRSASKPDCHSRTRVRHLRISGQGRHTSRGQRWFRDRTP